MIVDGVFLQARLTIVPCETGQLRILGLKYNLSSVAISGPVDDGFSTPAESHPAVSAVSIQGRLDLQLKGPRLNSTKVEKTSVVYGQDNRLNLVVVPAMPLLKVGRQGYCCKMRAFDMSCMVSQFVAEFASVICRVRVGKFKKYFTLFPLTISVVPAVLLFPLSCCLNEKRI